MTNFKLQKSTIERNKFYEFLICVLFVLFSAFLLYSFVSCINEIDTPSLYLLGNTLYALPYLIIFFIFFSFECCHKTNNYYEPICITAKGMSNVYKNQLTSISIYALALFLESSVINIVYIFISKQFSFALIVHTLFVLFAYFLICILSAVFIGFLLSQIKQKFISYIIIVIIAISETGLMDSLSVGIYNSVGIDTTKLLKFFDLAPSSIGWTPNMHSGYIITSDKLSQILFFIFLSLFFYYIVSQKKFPIHAKAHKSIICFCLCVLTVIGYILPFSAPNMDLSAAGVSSDMRYYEANNQLTELADFEIESYELEFKFRNVMQATAKIITNDPDKDEYKFTLYHGYKINKVTDDNNNKLEFERNTDYLTVYNLSGSEYIEIHYSGYSNKYYSNYANVFLPGNFAFYPVPGFHEMYSTSSYSGFNDLSLSYETDFNVKVSALNDVYCNLDEYEHNVFHGKSDSLTLLSGFIDCFEVQETEVYYPYFDNRYTADTINEKVSEFISNNRNIKKIIIIPNINLEDIEFVKTFDDYIITASIDDIERLSFISKISAKKLELYNAVNAYFNYPEYFEFLKENSSEELQPIIPLLEEILNGDADDEKTEAINQYLTDENDNRSFSELLNGLR